MKEKIKLIIAAIIVLSLLSIAVFLNSSADFEYQDINIEQPNTNLSNPNHLECLTKNNINQNSIIFLYSNSCPHCVKMKPIVESLENQGYEFNWVEGGDRSAVQPIAECFGDVLGGFVPQFICTSTKQTKVGEMSSSELKAFADNC